VGDFAAADRTDLFGGQRYHRDGLAIEGHEFHLVAAGLVQQRDRADVAALEAVRRQVGRQDDSIRMTV